MTTTIHTGDCMEFMRELDTASVDAVVTDPPYGLSKARPGGRSEATKGPVMGGFMGMKWDYDVPSVEVWRECLRVLKPGGYLLSFGGTRTYHRLATRIEDAGFTLHPLIAWVFGSGFPKATRIEDMPEMEGWRYGLQSLKPAIEPIAMAQKPFSEKTGSANIKRWGTGAINVDACRVELDGDYKSSPTGRPSQTGLPDDYDPSSANQPSTVGRWPANLIHDGSDEVLAAFPAAAGQLADASQSDTQRAGQNAYGAMNRGNEASADSDNEGVVGFKMKPGARRADVGSAARFFYAAKASRADRNAGCEDMDRKPLNWSSGTQNPGAFQADGTDKTSPNNHPTVKPTDLMRYLVRLVTPPGGVVLDPFMGSGSTGRAAVLEGFGFIGCDTDPDYVAIAHRRIFAAETGRPSKRATR